MNGVSIVMAAITVATVIYIMWDIHRKW